MAQPSGEVNKLNLRFSLSISTLAFLFTFIFLLSPNTANAAEVTIGLSLQATDGNTNNNITIQSPSGGGIAVGRHTLVINTNSYKGYNVTLNSNSSNSNLTNTNGNNSNNNIVPVAGTLTNPTSLTVDNTWGVAIPGKPGFGQDSDYTSTNTAAKYAAVPASSTTTTNNSILTKTSPSNTAGDNQPVVYGVKTASLTKAGSYKATVTYTATAQLPAKPTITSITPNSYQLGTDIATNPNASKITIAGTDLGSTNEVYIDTNGNSQKDTGEECTNLTIQSDNSITCNVPTTDVNAGTYDVHLSAQGGETTGQFSYIKPAEPPTITSISPNTFELGLTSSQTTITGTNLDTVNSAYVDLNNNGSMDSGEECQNISSVTSASFTCNVPILKTGSFNFYAATSGGTAKAPEKILVYRIGDTGNGGTTYSSYGGAYTRRLYIDNVSVLFAYANNKNQPYINMWNSSEKVSMYDVKDIFVHGVNGDEFMCSSLPGGRVVAGTQLKTQKIADGYDPTPTYSSGYNIGCHTDDDTFNIQEYLSGDDYSFYYITDNIVIEF